MRWEKASHNDQFEQFPTQISSSHYSVAIRESTWRRQRWLAFEMFIRIGFFFSSFHHSVWLDEEEGKVWKCWKCFWITKSFFFFSLKWIRKTIIKCGNKQKKFWLMKNLLDNCTKVFHRSLKVVLKAKSHANYLNFETKFGWIKKTGCRQINSGWMAWNCCWRTNMNTMRATAIIRLFKLTFLETINQFRVSRYEWRNWMRKLCNYNGIIMEILLSNQLILRKWNQQLVI